MPADTANLPPFRPLPYRGPDIEVRRGENGAVYLKSRSPMGARPRSIPHALDERAGMHPDRAWLKQRLPNPSGRGAQVTYGEGGEDHAVAGAGAAGSRAGRGCAAADPVGQFDRACADVAGGAADLGAGDADLAGLFDHVVGLREAEALLRCGEAEGDLRADDGPVPQGAGGACRWTGVAIISADGSEGSEAFAKLAETPATPTGRYGDGLARAGYGRQVPVHLGLDRHAETGAAEPGPDDGADRGARRDRTAAGRSGRDRHGARLDAVEPYLGRQCELQQRAVARRHVPHRRWPADAGPVPDDDRQPEGSAAAGISARRRSRSACWPRRWRRMSSCATRCSRG